ncbi:fumarate hydratase [bacterium]|nr:fumarate hydratase [bacterium]
MDSDFKKLQEVFSYERLKNSFFNQIKKASTSLPEDVENAIKLAYKNEQDGSVSQNILQQILDNVQLARKYSIPICQDTGTHIHYIYYPFGLKEKDIEKAVVDATIEATENSILRPNTVDPLTDKNSGNNIGEKNPQIHFHQWDENYIYGKLMLKGGGSENVSAQYSLPNSKLHAGRDLEGVRKTVLDAVFNAQGMGCAPGIIGVGVGGDRGSSFLTAKEQLFRALLDNNVNSEVDELEKKLQKEINELKIGPMGFGGNTTVLGVKIGFAHRLPASYFVSIAYMCWAHRKAFLTITENDISIKN